MPGSTWGQPGANQHRLTVTVTSSDETLRVLAIPAAKAFCSVSPKVSME
jgi:hypothetical protein